MELNGKVALVLGAIKGIGKGIGLALAQEDTKVALNYFDWEASLEEMQDDFKAVGAEHFVVRTDLLDTDAIPALIEKVVDRFGRLDILVNNIERGGWPVVHGPYVREQWDLEMATTLRAKWWTYRCALPHLKASGDGVGTVVELPHRLVDPGFELIAHEAGLIDDMGYRGRGDSSPFGHIPKSSDFNHLLF